MSPYISTSPNGNSIIARSVKQFVVVVGLLERVPL
jgi:hypothetical protein